MILEETPKSTRQLWKFLLKNSRVKRKGRVWELDLSPIKIASEESNLSEVEWGGLFFPFDTLKVTTIEGNGDAGT